MAPRTSGSTQKPNSRAVNNLLHTLRGEHFRRNQNAQGSKTHIPSSFVARNSPTLPVRLEHLFLDDNHEPSKVTSSSDSPTPRTYSGPTPPKSWTKQDKQDVDIRNTSSWRRDALSLVLRHNGAEEALIPPLTTLCLRILASYPSQEFAEDIVPWIPLHLRRELVRDAAVYAPLSNTKLFPLYEEQRHAAGEIIVVGPNGSLPEDYFLDPVLRTNEDEPEESQEQTVDDWDADEFTPEPITTLALVSTTLQTSTFLSTPPSLTALALVNLKSPVPLHRLPSTCPLLIILDLSYNAWLADEASAEAWLERVDWKHWVDLRILGFRECSVPENMLQKVNKGRWDDVEIIQ